jgi:hypothetical protein
MSLLQFHMLAYEFLKLQQKFLIIIFIVNIIIIIIIIIRTRHETIIFFRQVNFCSAKIGYSGLENQTIQFSQTGKFYLSFLDI